MFKNLELEGNHIGDRVLSDFLGGLKYNNSLRFLNLSHNDISHEGARDIKHYLRSS